MNAARRRRLTAALAIIAMGVGAHVSHAAEATPEIHGVSDAFAGSGVALAWGIARGADETSTFVVVRIATDGSRYPFVAAVGVDPFTGQKEIVMPPARVSGKVEFRSSRARFGDLPRTEFHFFESEGAAQKGAAALVVYYLGVPDTTPEMADGAALDASLATRLERARASKVTP